MAKTNFRNVGVRGDTKEELEELKNKLCEIYFPKATYDDLIRIFLQKNKRITLNGNELKELLLRSKGIKGVKWN